MGNSNNRVDNRIGGPCNDHIPPRVKCEKYKNKKLGDNDVERVCRALNQMKYFRQNQIPVELDLMGNRFSPEGLGRIYKHAMGLGFTDANFKIYVTSQKHLDEDTVDGDLLQST